MRLSIVIVFLSVLFALSNGAKILGVLHFPSKSHHIIGTSLLHNLAKRGHEVTVLSPFNSTKNIVNVREIYLDGVPEIWEEYRKLFMNGTSFSSIWKFKNFTTHFAEAALQSKGMGDLLKSGEKFDVVLIDPIGNEAFFGLGHLFNAHIVVLSPGGSSMLNHLAGNVAPYSFVPSFFKTYTDKMTFIQRTLNTLAALFYNIFYTFIIESGQRDIYERYFKDAPDYYDAVKNGSLFLVNTNIIFETPRPYLPNMVQVGGMHVEEPKKLPQDLQEYLDNSKEGVILFSLGSILKSADLPLEKRDAIMKVLGRLPQNILWKFEDENLPGKPKNVRINKWLPQSDILAHPNVRLFITHGGLLSSTEAVYRGVPILGIPFYADQHTNIAIFVNAGYGQSLSMDELTETTFAAQINEVLSNPQYRTNIQRDAEILKDQPTKPLDRAIFWVEHIIKHNGGHHLRCASLDLSLPEYLLLDVIAFVVFVLGTFIVGIYLSCKTIYLFFACKLREEATKKKRKLKAKRE